MGSLPDAHVPAVHARITYALLRAEDAIDALQRRHVLQGRFFLMSVISNIQRGANYYLTGGSQYDQPRQYLLSLIPFYQQQVSQLTRPSAAPAVSEAVYNFQGALAAGDPWAPGQAGVVSR